MIARLAQTLGGLGLLQAGYMGLQLLGWDPLQWPTYGYWRGGTDPLGTFGSVNVAAAFVALTVLLLPWPAWIAAGLVLLFAHAATALAALALGVAVHAYRARCLVGYALVLALLVALARPWRMVSLAVRLQLWDLGLHDWAASMSSILFGHGFGGWATRFRHIAVIGEVHPATVASNDYVQWLYETGLVGAAAFVVVVVRYGPTLLGSARFAPACVALAVLAAGSFPFHHPVLTALGVTILALAWREGECALAYALEGDDE